MNNPQTHKSGRHSTEATAAIGLNQATFDPELFSNINQLLPAAEAASDDRACAFAALRKKERPSPTTFDLRPLADRQRRTP
jgi:hypothetical protein